MVQIEIDFDVWKALTAKRVSETHSYNSVLRELLQLGAEQDQSIHPTDAGAAGGKLLGGRFLPDGTKLRARHKGRIIEARIEDGRLIDEDDKVHSSASSAARAVTGGTFNGLVFWEVRRPHDLEWRKIVALAKQP